MSTMVAVPDELVEQVRLVTGMQLDQFLIDAVRKQVRQIRALQIRDEYEHTHRRQTPRQVYERTLAGVMAFETQYGLTSERFLHNFEAGDLDEDPNDWGAFYRWRTMTYGLQRMEREYGFTREA
ncbi:MAG: hypothetical protein KBG20_12270 [Caldilineaceae bacterium]|nr:hypothetical protein [Caldilineaceae bacterium]MBP8109242.1 hypothetical protein [Caldilineaceae bacterium]MBP8125684.1 hypothetical protein [Caldilineaceae bacterium]MBP9073074.1 hypothetical protein [Caldilineaceae bacterium]